MSGPHSVTADSLNDMKRDSIDWKGLGLALLARLLYPAVGIGALLAVWWLGAGSSPPTPRITSYNVCYTKLLRATCRSPTPPRCWWPTACVITSYSIHYTKLYELSHTDLCGLGLGMSS